MISDCVRSHVGWMRLNASTGGEVGACGEIEWAFVAAERTMHLLFPLDPDPADVAAATLRADEIGARSTALWSSSDTHRPWLEGLGFERGWQPWWMGASAADVGGSASKRVSLVSAVRRHDRRRAPLIGRSDVLLAEAVERRRYAGRAWLHLDDEVAGLYDMEVRPGFRRRGLGRELLAVLAKEALRRGVERITLNATPEGATLYAASGFEMLGAGRTWWRHRC